MISKILIRLLNKFNFGGTSLPGKLALKLKPDILSRLSAGVKVICVTGTNGKTTTCALIEQGIMSCGATYLINKSGANMIGGITTAFLKNSSIYAKCKKQYAILECDENSLFKITQQVKPYAIVVTNIFRDQLDRYGEVKTTLLKIKEGIENCPNSILVLNADCPLTYSLSHSCSNKIISFGISDKCNLQSPTDLVYCPVCNEKLKYNSTVFSHLGNFKCAHCGYEHINPDFSACNLRNLQNGTAFLLNGCSVNIRLGGVYNVYNYLAAVSVLELVCVNFSPLSDYCGAFGRTEEFYCGDNKIILMLVKNPVGFSNCIDFVISEKKKKNIIIALNDNDADGRDVSWIWDVNFRPISKYCEKVYTYGTRAYDMSLRLKYDKIHSQTFSGEDYIEMVKKIRLSNEDWIIFSSYTAMMKMRHFLINEFGGDEFWNG